MSFTHGGFTFYGTQGPFQWGRWDNPLQRSKISGLEGVSILVLERGSREFSTEIWIHNNFASAAALRTYLGTIETHANVEGRLVRPSPLAATIESVRFDSMDLMEEAIPSSHLGWFAIARLNFEQLRP